MRLLLHGGSEGGDPSAVALKGALQDKLLSHSGGIDVSLELKGCRDRENKPWVEVFEVPGKLSVGEKFGYLRAKIRRPIPCQSD